MEAILGAISKFGWILVAGIMGQQFYEKRRDKARLDNTYTKQETEQQISLRMKPLETEIKHLTTSTQQLSKSIEELSKNISSLTVSQAVSEAKMEK